MLVMDQRQRAYTRRASQQDDLEESRTRHEQFRSSMFSSSVKAPTLPSLTQGESVDSDGTTGARIDAAIKAAMAVDAQRGANTFNRMSITPDHSANSSLFHNGIPVSGPPPAPGTTLSLPPPPTVAYPTSSRDAMLPPEQPILGGTHGGYSGSRDSSGYRSHYPSGGSGGNNSYLARATAAAAAAADESVSSGGAVYAGGNGGDRSGGVSDGGSGNIFAYGGVEEAVEWAGGKDARDGVGMGSGGAGAGAGGGVRRSGSGERPHGGSGEHGRSSWDRSGGGSTPKAVWRPDDKGDISEAGVGDFGGFDGRGTPLRHPNSSQSMVGSRQEADGRDGDAPPEWAPDVSPIKPGTGGDVPDQYEGGGGGVALTPTGYDEPLELPGSSHYISLAKFLEVMTGPGLRVRKHHRSGKGSSGLRVLRYNEDEDSLTWDSHKILGAAQHVLPMADVQGISMKSDNRVVLTCVGGKDSYAVFEAANDDAADVLLVGLERLRERTTSQK